MGVYGESMDNNILYLKKEIANVQKQLKSNLENVLFERQEEGILNVTREYREKFYAAICSGDEKLMERMLSCMLEADFNWVPGTLAFEDSRNIKNLSISAIAIMCDRLITDRVLDSEIACAISDAGIQMIEECAEIEKISIILIVCFIEFTAYVARQKKQGQHYHHLVKKAKDYVMKNLHGNIRVSEIADVLETNASYLSRIFKKYEGKTLQQYIQEERLLRAQNLLMVSELTLEEISSYLGFSSQSHFGKLLKEKTGMTPNEYRIHFNDSYREHL